MGGISCHKDLHCSENNLSYNVRDDININIVTGQCPH